MCGIAGLMMGGGASPDSDVLDRLSGALAHRGPDGHGCHLSGAVGMVQTRLAIIDLLTGDQPLYAPGRGDEAKAALVANGEIYNYIELKEQMPGTAFATGSDCELPLHLYLEQGQEFTKSLRGMYALAVHDLVADRLVLARDPFGIKPLYYCEMANGFAFASEPQALIAAGLVTAALNPRQRDALLQLQFTCGRETAFESISRVLPGETLVVEDGKIIDRIQHRALPGGARTQVDEAQALNNLDAALNDSVGVHQRSDVPYGMFFSGGVDSSVLLAMMTRLNERPVRALTAGFSGTAVHDERDHARSVAAAVGADHMEVEFSEDDFWNLLPAISAAIDDPTADYAVLPTYKLAARARAEGLKVVLSGEGGDELFAGYGRYRHAARPWPLTKKMRRKGILQDLGVLREQPANWREGIAAAERQESQPGRSALQVAQAVDCADWLPADLLTKLDRCLMAHGVEGRVPFLDPAIAEVAYLLPDRLKVSQGKGKWLLRRWLDNALPVAKAFESKRGFTVPVGQWIEKRSGQLGALVAAQPGIAEICRPGAVEALFSAGGKRQGKAQWTLLFYALWHRTHILGLPTQGDVFDSLSC
ncbi:MAG: asparagine synthase (glutamine-hydrolyzing) [Rhodospirillaceae bacterium]|jgi:asparagine synthase (glutamine-hydrolysing)|nr:asparagine synthase (glutamine-hydrolyzing) [Rhodospirillaceae bacterium]MBT5244864.1 asparagine synthase (glutamine-hydrolyzing) [Rhodospirillaceae bacterium]MBT5562226.1 asparagine synthase (glutamine-hydrolyzing) [Rhodospirillaceae bacterium]MBT6242399.1 asparagine synthase (glutamine-hydrolyzing) [Rhodospirillaceae bacterium]MBT7138894.1 asparagine synthase (glutamine-hydrolyzing) [Rhodospirillaceae bacterium]